MEKTDFTDMISEKTQNDNSELEGKYLTFYLEKQLFGIPIADVMQIISIQDIIELPDSPYYVKGIINLRGSIIPIIDARIRLGKAETPPDEHSCIIVTNIHEKLIGFLVDGVDEVTYIGEDEISPPPSVSAESAGNAFLTGIGKQENRVILLMVTARLLNESELDMLDYAMQA